MLLNFKILLVIFIGLALTACGSDAEFYPHVSTPYNLNTTTVSADSIRLNWEYDGPADFTQQFYIYRDGVHTYSTGRTSITISGLSANTQYCFYVTSKNIWYQSSPSNTSCATTDADTSPPYTFNANLVARLNSSSEANLRWNQYFDNVKISGYKVYRNNTYLTTVNDLTMNDNSLLADTEYCYYVVAYDPSGNESIPTNTSCVDTAWKVTSVDNNVEISSHMSISVDSTAAAHIVAYDRNSGYLLYIHNKSGSWSVTDIDYIESNEIQYMSIVTDGNDDVHIAYYDPINSLLKYATNKAGDWVISQIDSSTGSGKYVSMTRDNNDKLHISYYTGSKLNYLTNSSGSWVKETVDDTLYHMYSSIDVSSNGYVHIAYSDFINHNVVYITNMSGNWVKTDLTSISGNIPDSSTFLAVDENDKAHICLHGNGYLTNQSGTWVSTNILTSGTGYCSIALSPDGKVHISRQIQYSRIINQTSYAYHELIYTTNKDSSWKSYILDDSSSGWYSNLTMDNNNDIHIANLKLFDYSLRYATTK